MIKDYLADVDVTMTISPVESGAYRNLTAARSYEAAIFTGVPTTLFPWKMHSIRSENPWCPSYFESEYTRNIYNEVCAAFGKDPAKVNELLKKSQLYELESATAIWMPGVNNYTFWWPWVQNYTGENIVGYYNEHGYVQYIWVDEALKESMGY